MQEVAILKLQKVGFTYPGTDRRVLSDVTLRCTLNSRIAVLGVRSHDRRPRPAPHLTPEACNKCEIHGVPAVFYVASSCIYRIVTEVLRRCHQRVTDAAEKRTR